MEFRRRGIAQRRRNCIHDHFFLFWGEIALADKLLRMGVPPSAIDVATMSASFMNSPRKLMVRELPGLVGEAGATQCVLLFAFQQGKKGHRGLMPDGPVGSNEMQAAFGLFECDKRVKAENSVADLNLD